MARHPISGGAECAPDGIMTRATVELGGQPVAFGAVHLTWPWPHDQADIVGELAPYLAMLDGPALLAGDLNAVPWSATAGRLAEFSGLQPVPGIGPTYLPLGLPAGLRPLIGLPIDSVFAGGVNVMDAVRLEDVGSDHLPVLVTFALRSEAPMMALANR